MASMAELGRVQSTHPRTALLRSIGLSFVVLAAILIGSALARPRSVTLTIAVGSGMALSFLVLLAIDRLMSPVTSVDVHELGIAVHQRGKSLTACFDEIDAIHYDLEVASTLAGRMVRSVRMDLVLASGERIKIPRGLLRVDEIVHALDVRCTRPLWPDVRSAHERGEPLTFGPIAITADGMVRAGHTVAWSAIASVRPEPDRLQIGLKDGGRWVVRVREIPHPRLLVNVLGMHVEISPATGAWAE